MGLGNKQKKNKTRKLSILLKMLLSTGIIMIVMAALLTIISCKQVEDGLVEAAVEAADTAGNVAEREVDGDTLSKIKKVVRILKNIRRYLTH